MQRIYFHLNSALMAPGSVVLPGNFGRMMRMHTHDPMMYREHILEIVRQTQFPDKPSRLKSAFVTSSLEEAVKFKVQTNRTVDLIYEVEFVEDVPLHQGDWGKIEAPHPWLDHLQQVAVEYWQGYAIENKEIFGESALRIIRMVNG